MLLSKIGTGFAVSAALVLGASPALAAGGWTIVSVPPTGQNANLSGVSTPSDTDAWAVGTSNGAKNTGLGSKPLIDHWNGTAWNIVPSPSTGTNDSLTGVTESATNNLWAVGYDTPSGATQPQTLTLNYNGTAWTTIASPNQGTPSVLTSVSTTPGAAIVWTVGYSGLTGSFNPLALKNG
jgi:hypothetical protein